MTMIGDLSRTRERILVASVAQAPRLAMCPPLAVGGSIADRKTLFEIRDRSVSSRLRMVYSPRMSLPIRLFDREVLNLGSQRVERKLSAIFAADVEGYSRLMGQDEVGTLRRALTAYRLIIDRLIASHRGRIFNTAGDSLVTDFASAVDAVQCAVEVQEAITNENSSRPAELCAKVGDGLTG